MPLKNSTDEHGRLFAFNVVVQVGNAQNRKQGRPYAGDELGHENVHHGPFTKKNN